jgi:hypothetical protein
MNLHDGRPEMGSHAWLLRAKLCKVVYIMKTLKETKSPNMKRTFIFQIFSHVRGMVLYYGLGIMKVTTF